MHSQSRHLKKPVIINYLCYSNYWKDGGSLVLPLKQAGHVMEDKRSRQKKTNSTKTNGGRVNREGWEAFPKATAGPGMKPRCHAVEAGVSCPAEHCRDPASSRRAAWAMRGQQGCWSRAGKPRRSVAELPAFASTATSSMMWLIFLSWAVLRRCNYAPIKWPLMLYLMWNLP